jgi:hypothetical protein
MGHGFSSRARLGAPTLGCGFALKAPTVGVRKMLTGSCLSGLETWKSDLSEDCHGAAVLHPLHLFVIPHQKRSGKTK